MKKKTIEKLRALYFYGILLTCIILLITLASAESTIQTLGNIKSGDSINLIQNCINSTYSNISRITYPNKTFALDSQTVMTKNGFDYNYTFSNTNTLGEYLVYGSCDENGVQTSWVYSFTSTSTGQQVSLSNIIIVIAFLVVAAMVFVLGYSFDKEKWIIKSGLYIFALLFSLLAINSAAIIASESTGLNYMGTSGLIAIITIISFMFVYIMVLWTIQTFKSVKEKQGIRWKY